MELIEVILSKENLNRAYKKVVANKGASGVDGVTVEELGDYIRENREKIITSLRNRTYIPKPVRRVYIPKDNGKKRPLGIPIALDRTIQQAIAQPISDIYEEIFSDYSYGFRAGRSCHDAIRQALEYLNDGYEWVVDIDIEQFFDKVNHDKLIQIVREQVNDSTTLNLIRKYLKASGFTFFLLFTQSMPESSGQYFIHTGIIIRTLHSFNFEFAVIVPFWFPMFIDYHRSDRIESVRIGNIICLHAYDAF